MDFHIRPKPIVRLAVRKTPLGSIVGPSPPPITPMIAQHGDSRDSVAVEALSKTQPKISEILVVSIAAQ